MATSAEIALIAFFRALILAILAALGVWLARKFPRKEKPLPVSTTDSERWRKVGRKVGQFYRAIAQRIRPVSK